MVKAMAGYGVPQEEIATILTIAPHTLRRHFRPELDRGAAEAKAQVLQTLFKMAVSGKVPAATFFFAKTRCGLREGSGAPEKLESQPPDFRVQIEGDAA